MTTTYAPRYYAWPPPGYIEPTPAEFEELRRHIAGKAQRSARMWERLSDADLTRRAQLLELIGPMLDRTERAASYDYAHALRAEQSRRGVWHQSLAIPRCERCSHGAERVFEATQETHGLEHPAWLCVQCWSETGGGDA